MSLGGMSASFNTSFSDITGAAGDVLGKQGTQRTRGSSREVTLGNDARLGTRQLQLDPAALQQIIADVLGAEQGMSAIFSQEKGAGLYNSTVSANAMGDLTSKLVGEIAKITGRETTTELGTKSDTKTASMSNVVTNEVKGILDQFQDEAGDADRFGIVNAIIDSRGNRRGTPPGEEVEGDEGRNEVNIFPSARADRGEAQVNWNPYTGN